MGCSGLGKYTNFTEHPVCISLICSIYYLELNLLLLVSIPQKFMILFDEYCWRLLFLLEFFKYNTKFLNEAAICIDCVYCFLIDVKISPCAGSQDCCRRFSGRRRRHRRRSPPMGVGRPPTRWPIRLRDFGPRLFSCPAPRAVAAAGKDCHLLARSSLPGQTFPYRWELENIHMYSIDFKLFRCEWGNLAVMDIHYIITF